MPYLMKLVTGEEIICMTIQRNCADEVGYNVTNPTLVECGLPTTPWISGVNLTRLSDPFFVPQSLIISIFEPSEIRIGLIRTYMNIDDEDDLPTELT